MQRTPRAWCALGSCFKMQLLNFKSRSATMDAFPVRAKNQTLQADCCAALQTEVTKNPTTQKSGGVTSFKLSNESQVLEDEDSLETKHEIKMKEIIAKTEKRDKKGKKKSSWKSRGPLSTDHYIYTQKFFQANPFYNKLTEQEKIFHRIFWTTRYCRHTERELAKNLEKNQTDIHVLLCLLESEGFIKIKRQFNTGKNGNKRRTRGHISLTRKGERYLKGIINKSIYGIAIPEAVDSDIVVVGGVFKLKRFLRPCDKKRMGVKTKKSLNKDVIKEYIEKANVKEVLESHNKVLLCNTIMPGKSADFSLLLLNKKTNLLFKNVSKPPTPKKIPKTFEYFQKSKTRMLFAAFDLAQEYDQMGRCLLEKIEELPKKKLLKALKRIRKKQLKGFRVKNFPGFFTHYVFTDELKSFQDHKLENFELAIKGERVARIEEGIDSANFVEMVQEIEKMTHEKMPQKILKMVLNNKHSLQVATKALEAAMYRITLDKKAPTRTTHTEDIYEEREISEDFVEEVAARNEDGTVKRDADGKIIWVDEVQKVSFWKNVFVGTKTTVTEKKPKEKVKSWVGLFVYALNLGSLEEIHDKFFARREARSW